MGLTSLLFIGLVGVFFILLFKRSFMALLRENNKWVHMLKHAMWFQNHWLAGVFLFVMNAVFFFLTGIVIRLTGYYSIPYVHLIIMIAAVIASLYLWMAINKAWQGTNRDRLKMGTVGSSFFGVLSILFIYWLVTLEPSYSGEDTFMQAIGLMLGTIVTTVAFITCFIVTGYTDRKVNK